MIKFIIIKLRHVQEKAIITSLYKLYWILYSKKKWLTFNIQPTLAQRDSAKYNGISPFNLPANCQNLSRFREQNLGPVPRSRKSNVSQWQIDTLDTRHTDIIKPTSSSKRGTGRPGEIRNPLCAGHEIHEIHWFIKANASEQRRMSTGNV